MDEAAIVLSILLKTIFQSRARDGEKTFNQIPKMSMAVLELDKLLCERGGSFRSTGNTV